MAESNTASTAKLIGSNDAARAKFAMGAATMSAVIGSKLPLSVTGYGSPTNASKVIEPKLPLSLTSPSPPSLIAAVIGPNDPLTYT